MKPTTFLLGALLIFSACKRDDGKSIVTTKVHGHLMVLGTEEIIKDKPYKIQFREVNYAGLAGVLDEVYTDENGYFEFEYSDDKDEEKLFTLYFDRSDVPDETFTGAAPRIIDTTALPPTNAPPPSPGSYKGNRKSIPPGYQSWANVCLEKKAWLELEVENIGGSFGDRIRILYTSYRGDQVKWEYVFQHQQHFTVILPGVGNVGNYIDYWVRKDGVSIPRQRATIKLGEMDTTYFKLEY